ncbi:methanogenesis marker protein Mmp4/MtxX [Methanosphaera sp. WGK6]|uniref:methanogenesis marker protein Mmp4/MtxX n=1 Tax=Methanosphaera sp. WGK6 TaxID=1561964 RepID=UPI00084C8FF3|nr:methanogenesis marker protein Mmp4/MtxX [Methanosphaera sp. WGK6]OED30430.1 methyltransferase [Methanosphaera sp. WGK6]
MKIAIGLGKNKNVLEAIKQFSFDFEIAETNEDLIKYIHDPTIDGVIRGSLESSVIKELKKEYPNLFRASILEINNHKFMLTPVGIDECDTIDEKKEIIKECSKIISKTGNTPKIALISGGRKQDKGRSPKIDKTIRECDIIVEELKNDYDIKHYYILIEEAIKNQVNIIVAPDGIIGNIIFRSLVLVSGVTSYGAITLKQPNIYIDTSRSQSVQGYVNSIKLVSTIINSLKK